MSSGGGAVASGGGGGGDGCFEGCSQRVCVCCFKPQRTTTLQSRHPRYQPNLEADGFRNRGRYAPKRKRIFQNFEFFDFFEFFNFWFFGQI